MPDSPVAVGASIARSLRAMAAELKKAEAAVNRDSGDVARKHHRATAAASAGPDRVFSHGKKLGKLDVKTRRQEGGGITVAPTGPWKIAEEGPSFNPSQGKQAWSKAEKATVDELDKVIPKTLDAAADRGFRA